jgi:hypothetical protein
MANPHIETPDEHSADGSPGRELIEWLRDYAQHAQGKTGRPPWPHSSLQGFVHAEGSLYLSARLSAEERRLVRQVATSHRLNNGPFRARDCFANAQGALLLDRFRRLVYAEGFVHDQRSSLPFLHGWLVLEGKVVDFTDMRIDGAEVRISEPPYVLGEFQSRHYFGVEFCRDYVKSRIASTGGRGTLIDDWEHEFPLLRSSSIAWRRK